MRKSMQWVAEITRGDQVWEVKEGQGTGSRPPKLCCRRVSPSYGPTLCTAESTVLQVEALLEAQTSKYTLRQRAAAAVGFLLAMDCYGRSNDIVLARADELRALEEVRIDAADGKIDGNVNRALLKRQGT